MPFDNVRCKSIRPPLNSGRLDYKDECFMSDQELLGKISSSKDILGGKPTESPTFLHLAGFHQIRFLCIKWLQSFNYLNQLLMPKILSAVPP